MKTKHRVMAVLAVAALAAIGVHLGIVPQEALALAPFVAVGATNFIEEGRALTVTAPYAVSSGGGMLVGTALFGVADATISSGGTGVMLTSGVYDIAKATGVSFAAGARVYWDDTNKVVTTSGTGSTLEVGVCVSTGGTAATTLRTKIPKTI